MMIIVVDSFSVTHSVGYSVDLAEELGLEAVNALETSIKNCSVINGRSVPCALAIDSNFYRPKLTLNVWQRVLEVASEGEVLYVSLDISDVLAKSLCGLNKAANKKARNRFNRIFNKIFIPKIRINVAEIEIKDGVNRICQALKK